GRFGNAERVRAIAQRSGDAVPAPGAAGAGGLDLVGHGRQWRTTAVIDNQIVVREVEFAGPGVVHSADRQGIHSTGSVGRAVGADATRAADVYRALLDRCRGDVAPEVEDGASRPRDRAERCRTIAGADHAVARRRTADEKGSVEQ